MSSSWSFSKHAWVYTESNIEAFYDTKVIDAELSKIIDQPVNLRHLDIGSKTKIHEIDFMKKLKTTSRYYNLTLSDFVLCFIKPYRILNSNI
jgi:hypothetical protein